MTGARRKQPPEITPMVGAERIELVSLKQLLAELGDDADHPLPRSTFYQWREQGIAPFGFQLRNRQLRFRRHEVNRWIQALETGAAWGGRPERGLQVDPGLASPIELVSLKQFRAELGEDPEHPLPKSTFYDWDALGDVPVGFSLPGGQRRFRRTEVNRWILHREARAS